MADMHVAVLHTMNKQQGTIRFSSHSAYPAKGLALQVAAEPFCLNCLCMHCVKQRHTQQEQTWYLACE